MKNVLVTNKVEKRLKETMKTHNLESESDVIEWLLNLRFKQDPLMSPDVLEALEKIRRDYRQSSINSVIIWLLQVHDLHLGVSTHKYLKKISYLESRNKKLYQISQNSN